MTTRSTKSAPKLRKPSRGNPPKQSAAKDVNAKATVSKRIEFSPTVKDDLYRQAGGRCSVPRCTNPTAGPYYQLDGVANMGIACHIYSASPGGPRGQGGKDKAFLGSAHNGIWCCAYHGNLIDKKKGADYPAVKLFAWKALAEARAYKQMTDQPSPLGWVESIEYKKFSGDSPGPKIVLSRNSLLVGRNGGGKTLLMEAAACVSDERYAWRLKGKSVPARQAEVSSRISVLYSTADTLRKEVRVDVAGGRMTRFDGDTSMLLPPGDLEVICSPTWPYGLQPREGQDDVDMLASVLGIDRAAILMLLDNDMGPMLPVPFQCRQAMEVSSEDEDDWADGDEEDANPELVPKLRDNDEPFLKVWCKMEEDDYRSIETLSGSETNCFLLDLLIAKARATCRHRLTLLLIDADLVYNLPEYGFETLLRTLAAEDFQVVVALPPTFERYKDAMNGGEIPDELSFLQHWQIVPIQHEMKFGTVEGDI
ncbi:hypothetical protein ABFG95_08000 [Achromobacter sp. HNDS-1]|uniref:Uncharacterized protein n=1 Tax=Achromobacter sp. HNDS-1 TaxID=3151598 RepID=A0AAU7LF31_9BURK